MTNSLTAVSSTELISVDEVAKTYHTEDTVIPAVKPVSFSVGTGESVALVGPSGCGKTTLLLLLAGLERASSGQVVFKGIRYDKPRKEIALVLQEYGLFPWKTVRQNIELGLRIRKAKIVPAQIDAMLNEMDIIDKADLYPQQLSGGQKQRVALARTLIVQPELLLMDEPFAALDTLTRERLQDLVIDICRRRNLGMVLVTHTIPEAVFLCRTIVVMNGKPGGIIATLSNPCAGEWKYRGSDEFYAVSRKVRTVLENGDA